ncbi:hypothetical protein [Rhizobium bangladeshense]|uniref:hypothetical protein n=1 Tax=Rhizobium bangladeshense TaxID=1138189 RepID=UPI0007E59C2F|nr:hypothetical protein [Rhizobium bangladeshense]
MSDLVKVQAFLHPSPREILRALDIGRNFTDNEAWKNAHFSSILHDLYPRVVKRMTLDKYGSDCGIVDVNISKDREKLFAVFNDPDKAMLFKLAQGGTL